MYLLTKRVFDIIFSVLFIILLTPIMIVVSILIFLTSSGPIVFSQNRLGQNGRIISVFKFRSMIDKKRDPTIQVTSATAELTVIGEFLRRWKIDEIPQLFNILIGQMSLVGPRPCLEETKNIFNEDGHKRLLVKPGLTGLAQVNGGVHLTWENRWAFDRFYVENQCLKLDLKILIKTVFVVFLGESWGKINKLWSV